ncbi:hypothetical protein KZP23_07480 [Echinicola marina]|uniref:hypothetical protein n=1 Tax=Echinicola marina TaxID=2859768 RepID=UPI001CF62988|nr:hypothetical protein [Echinicola marina]UCS94841.1 hypothetical protein KZP23_07480 [Echinicola marina]
MDKPTIQEVTFNNLPEAIQVLLQKVEKLERQLSQKQAPVKLPRIIPMAKAVELTGRSANALRIQISQGNLKSIKKDGYHYFDTEYLLSWMEGKTGAPKKDSSEILVASR